MNHSTSSRPALLPDGYAAGLRSAITADPAARLVAGVQGAGGYGKTAVLDQLARAYRDAGVPVFGANSLDRAGEGAVLVDDAHRLAESVLGELREIARRPEARLVVAYRPGPRPAALGELISELGAPVLLSPLGRDEIAAHAATASPEWIDWVRAQTGGVARYVHRVLAAAEPGKTELPTRALDEFQHDLDQLGEAGWECVTAMAVGATPHPDLLAALLDLDSAVVGSALLAVRAGGLVGADDALLPIVRAAALRLTPWERRLRVTRRLVEIQLARGGSVLPLVSPLLGADIALLPEATLAAAFEKAAEEALRDAPHLAQRLFAAAVSAGTPAASVAARQARAAAVAGELDEALRLADQVIVDDAVPDKELGVQVAASVLAHRGLLERSAELCRWSVGRLRWPGDRAFAAVGLIGVGRLSDADELLRSSDDAGPPTSMTGAAAQLAAGARESVVGSSATALSTLVRAASLSEPVGRHILAPDTPASIAALVALHCGELDVAQSTLDRVIESGTGGPLLRNRHRLLAAWLPLVRGDTVTARAKLPATTQSAVRDRLLATAIEAGIASRDNDMAALAAARGQAKQAVAEHSVDLFALLPLGELLVAAARLRDQDWLAPYLAEARALLDRLGNPPLWTSMLTWKRLHAAIVLEELDVARQLAAELGGLAHHNPLAAAMAEAARVWLRIVDGQVDQDEVEQASRALTTAGLAWDGARLAGQAALRTADRRAMLALLECARALQGKPPRPRAVRGAMSAETDLLSEREKEVAELVLAGLTYKQVGKRLFISAKTVEHHISRIKQRLGCANREDLLNRLRELLGQ
ncbi:LuxR C-terminal-related transcriptional regulator [Saccharopolyspora phatthalungensis]|uniref:DNA-binding CsgD family transcriptional regulator n=1 Tax=Saccharopolyspora phatthalungensis TaxID=664693 RepID=A0A840QB28_9PSEU|nr:LuxR C-terminal-related transcriptional regulator [Saccharopolyspora phatthalungensis]MBB5154053.1 DNA-binding CsgD family transcriptional regulator [Saccharopolyspora phatthalungensis]